MRKLLSLILILVLCAAMVPAALAEGDVIEITVFHYMVEGDKAEGMEKIQELFKQAHPEVTIEFENLAYSQGTDFWPQLETAIAAGDNPEIIMGNPGLYVNLIEEGYIMDLTGNEVIQELGLSAGDMGDVSYQGKWYAYPVDFKSWGVFYNTKIFEELGLEVPAPRLSCWPSAKRSRKTASRPGPTGMPTALPSTLRCVRCCGPRRWPTAIKTCSRSS